MKLAIICFLKFTDLGSFSEKIQSRYFYLFLECFQGCITVYFSRFFVRCLFDATEVILYSLFHLVNNFFIFSTFYFPKKVERRGWDSNPCAREGKRFSRPPRYDHFDTSPFVLCRPLLTGASVILALQIINVNNYFHFFSKKFKIPQNPLFIRALRGLHNSISLVYHYIFFKYFNKAIL